MCFNLLDAKWIPVIWRDGKSDRIGICDALTKAPEIREVCAASPLDTVALYRFLLAVLQWCKPDPTDDAIAKARRERVFPEEWLTKLEPKGQYAERFLLLGGNGPFYQDSHAGTKASATSLIHELPSGTNVAHFRHTRDLLDGLCPACCALGLVRLPVFTTSKGAGNYPGINQVPPLYTIPLGGTLFDTLLLNWPMPYSPDDRPAWDRADAMPGPDQKVGALEGFTWLPRRIALGTEPISPDRCAWCAERTDRLCHAIRRQKPDRNEVSRMKERVLRQKWRDPQLAYSRPPQKSKTSEAIDTGALKAVDGLDDQVADVGAWREIWSALLSEYEQDQYIGPPACVAKQVSSVQPNEVLPAQVIGFATDGKAKYYDAWLRTVRPPAKLLCDRRRCGLLRTELSWLAEVIHRTLDPRTRSWKQPVKKMRGATFLRLTAPRPDRKCHSTRAAMSGWLPQAELLLQGTFSELVSTIASAEDATLSGLLTPWRDDVRGILATHLNCATTGTACGSPLRRQEGAKEAEHALHRAIRDVNQDMETSSEAPEQPPASAWEHGPAKPERRKARR